MGVEMIRDRQGGEHIVLSDEDFCNDNIMGDKFEDYEILQVIGNNDNDNDNDKDKKVNKNGKKVYGFFAKVRSKKNSKIYGMKVIKNQYIPKNQVDKIREELEKLIALNHPNIVKYYKYFFENDDLYIICEYINNGDLNRLIRAYESLKKGLDNNLIWNIFMQCTSALKYIHDNNIIHKNISNSNIFMTENKIIKLGDFQLSFLANNNCQYTKKTDIYAMGIAFDDLCHYDKNNNHYYSQEIENTIECMKKNENERPDDNILNNYVMGEYIKNVAKISSIDSVFRCMYSFLNFSTEMIQKAQSFSNLNETPISYNFVHCILNYNNGLCLRESDRFLNNFRNLLYENSQINNDIEIKPSLVLEFLLEKLNKETGSNNSGSSFKIQDTQYDVNKDNSWNLFDKFFNDNFKSVISKYFVGFIKTKRICTTNPCKLGTYSFNLFPYIEFDLERFKDNLNIANWFNIQNNFNVILSKEHNIECKNCQCVREHFEFKQFYKFPMNFIISINRGEGFKNRWPITFPKILNLQGYVEKGDNKIFDLVGIVKRMIDNNGNEYYMSIYYDNRNKVWNYYDRIHFFQNNYLAYDNNDGMVMLLFYSARINIGN